MSSSSSSAVAPPQQSVTRYINPITCIIHNFPVIRDAAGKSASKSLNPLRDILIENEFSNVRAIHPAWISGRGFIGYALIEFRGDGLDDFRQAKQLAARYASRDHQRGKSDFYVDDPKDHYVHVGPYLWVATAKDAHLMRRFILYKFIHVPKSWEDEEVPHFDHPLDADVVSLIYNQVYPQYPPPSQTPIRVFN